MRTAPKVVLALLILAAAAPLPSARYTMQAQARICLQQGTA